jgi:hypothetical protein
MPISTITILALYGELRELALAVETISNDLPGIAELEGIGNISEALWQTRSELRAAINSAERAAIEVIMRDAPRIHINPLTGEAG